METLRPLLTDGPIEIEGRMPWSSNGTFLVRISDEDTEAAHRAVYKPVRGERPLWDFPPGLHRREVAAYELSRAMGWDIVPITVLRDGPLGEGSVQLFIEADFEQHYFTLVAERPDLHTTFRRMAAFDIVANNTDRKAGHCLLGLDGQVYGIDNGLCFGAEPKLRTVIWEFGGEPIDDDILDALDRIAHALPECIVELLSPDEAEQVSARAARLRDRAVFPVDRTGRAYPWPLV